MLGILACLRVEIGSELKRLSLRGLFVCWTLVRSIGVERTIFFYIGCEPYLIPSIGTYLSWGEWPSLLMINWSEPLISFASSGAQTSQSLALVTWGFYCLSSSYMGILQLAKWNLVSASNTSTETKRSLMNWASIRFSSLTKEVLGSISYTIDTKS